MTVPVVPVRQVFSTADISAFFSYVAWGLVGHRLGISIWS